MKRLLSVVPARESSFGRLPAPAARALPIEVIELNPVGIWQDNSFMGINQNRRVLFWWKALFAPEQIWASFGGGVAIVLSNPTMLPFYPRKRV